MIQVKSDPSRKSFGRPLDHHQQNLRQRGTVLKKATWGFRKPVLLM